MSSSNFTVPNSAQVQNDPVYLLPFLYISGLNISVASTTVLAIAPGQARDSNDNIDMPVAFPNLQGNVNPAIQYQNYMPPLFVNSAVNGANGLDYGSLIDTMDYAIYLIGDSRGYNNVAGILSLTSNAAPLLPFGYDSYRLIGFIQTSASATFVASSTNPINMRNAIAYYLSPAVSVLSGGNATTFTAINLSTPIPTTTSRDVIAYLQVTFIPSAIGDTVQFRPTNEGTPQTAGLVTIAGISAGIAQTQYVKVICGVSSGSIPEIDYKVTVSGDSVTVLVTGYKYIPTSYVP
jgi:hypothetical protein